MGCDEAQGYFMSRPLPEAKLNVEWLRTSPFGLDRDNALLQPLAHLRLSSGGRGPGLPAPASPC